MGKREMTKAMMKKITTLMITGLIGTWVLVGQAEESESAISPAAAEETTAGASVNTEDLLRDDHPEYHTVVKGDTLWDISSRFLKNPWMWPEIWHVNPQIANPHLIYPGDVVKLIYLEGSPRLTVKRGEGGMTYKMSPGTAIAGDGRVSDDGRLKPSVRVAPLDEPIPAIPLDIIDPFLTGTRILDPGVFEGAPYVVQGSQRHVVTGAGADLYARGNFDEKHVVYGFFRKGKVYIDPDTKEVLGVQATDIGTGKMRKKEGDIARLSVVRTTQEVRSGDRLLADQERRVDSTFFPSSPDNKILGNIIDIEGGVAKAGAMSVVLIDKGERDGLKSGNVLAIYQRGEIVTDRIAEEDIRLMDERAGLLMVFAPFEKLSYALVLYADRPVGIGDRVQNP